MKEFTPAIFSTKFSNGKRTFFFDVKSSKANKPYIKITMTSIKGEEKIRSYTTIFEEEAEGYYQALSEIMGFLSTIKK